MQENYDDDQHIEDSSDASEGIMQRYNNTFRQLAASERWEKWCENMNSECTHLGFDAWACECGPGWIPLLEILFIYADEWNRTTPDGEENEKINITQVKEKFGSLRFYYTGGSDEFRGMVTMAEMLSSFMCERCGDRGDQMVSKHGWITTECHGCRGSRKDKKSD
jgi:hypothetical protein